MMTGCMKQSSEGDSSNKKKEAVKVPEGLWDPYEDTVTISTVLPEMRAFSLPRETATTTTHGTGPMRSGLISML